MDTKQLGRVWAATPNSPNIDPGKDKYNLGWIPEIPVYQVLNFINNRQDTNILSLAERGMFQWGSDVIYKINSLAWNEADGWIYVALVNNPSTSLTPQNNPSQWAKSSIQITRTEYDAAVANWNSHMSNYNNPHQITCDIIDTYTRAQIDALVRDVQVDIDNHAANLQNPHRVSASQVGAVPVTGGTYTGHVNHTSVTTGFGLPEHLQNISSDVNGMYLTKGNAKLGLNGNTEAVFINDEGVSSPILSEQDYVELRVESEALFTPPMFDLGIDLRNTINIRYGVGTSTFTAPAGRGYTTKGGLAATAGVNEPRYTVDGLIVESALSEVFTLPSTNNLAGFQAYSVHLECKPVSSTSSFWLATWRAGSISCGFAKETNDTLTYYHSVGGVVKSIHICVKDDWVNLSLIKVTVTSMAGSVKVYFNGKVVGSSSDSPNLVTNNNPIQFCPVNGKAFYNAFKTWAKVLTDKQVTNL